VAARFDGELRLLTAAEGGRETPLASGYRSIIRFGTEDGEPAWGVEITFDAPAVIAPGESAEVHLWSWAWGEADSTPTSGTRMFVYEGAQLVATGTIR
jgi:translation elongation factor EF-Tu-like GTPase